MPNRDGTGPQGQGPQTGRGNGKCRGGNRRGGGGKNRGGDNQRNGSGSGRGQGVNRLMSAAAAPFVAAAVNDVQDPDGVIRGTIGKMKNMVTGKIKESGQGLDEIEDVRETREIRQAEIESVEENQTDTDREG